VMLSEESAMGKYPIDAVAMLAKIAAAIEPTRSSFPLRETLKGCNHEQPVKLSDLIALSVETTLEHSSPAMVIVPTHGGATARSITRFRLPVWIAAVSSMESTCERLQLSYGVCPVHEPTHPDDWRAFAGEWLDRHGIDGNLVILTEGPSSKYPDSNNRMEIINLNRPSIS
jgi:pyruvate kinase